MDLSIVIALLNEDESLNELYTWIKKVVDLQKYSYEIIFIDDGSSDNSWQIIKNLKEQDSNVRGFKFRKNYGKSAALNTGFQAAQGDYVITMDADLQDSPEEIPSLIQMIKDNDYDIVSGWKKKRYDPITKTIPTKIYNGVTRLVTGVKLHDMNCGLKAYKKAVVKNIEVYGEMHRYIPAIAKWNGFPKIGEKEVIHQARKYGSSKFGLNRFINGFLDLMSVTFTNKFGRKPMHLFGTIGTLCFFIGGIITLYIFVRKMYSLYVSKILLERVTEDPLFYLALVTMVIGVQLFVAGFLGDLIARTNIERNIYGIDERI